MPDFLLEIGCEEIPARMLSGAQNDLQFAIAKLLADQKLSEGSEVTSYSTPRRLAVRCERIQTRQQDTEEQLQGPSVKVAFKDGKATAAAEAFAKKAGVAVEKLEKVQTPKGEYLSAKVVKKGRTAREILSELLPKEIASIYWPKSMYWRASAPERFVRPIRWMVALLDGEVIPLEFAGVRAGDISSGHRSIAIRVHITAPNSYSALLEKHQVLVDVKERDKRVHAALDHATHAVAGARWRSDAGLMETVVNLTEWPAAILGNFDKEFLSLPEEVLVMVMRDHQKYFAVEDSKGKLLPHFLAVLNTKGDPEGLIRHGNERVLRARFNDARFFWQADQKIPLKNRIDLLKHVTFQRDLGNYYDKTERVEKLAQKIAEELSDDSDVDRQAVAEAAWLCKADLTTELVKEFTELQGVIGGLYAREQEHEAVVADAIYDHYKPQSMEDEIPRTLEGAVLSIADKTDSIVGMFALGLHPTGSKDPFGLRRQGNGVVRILAEKKLNVGIRRIIRMTRAVYENRKVHTTAALTTYEEALLAFFCERLEFYLREARGFAYDTVNAVLAAGSEDVRDALARAEAVAAVRSQPDFEAISLSFKRIKNILRQAAERKIEPAAGVKAELAQEDAERYLVKECAALGAAVERHRNETDYAAALAEIAKLRPVLDKFFDKVMVMAEDAKLRANRLALLRRILTDFSTIADFSEIVTEGKTS